jgi:hypothetical protein
MENGGCVKLDCLRSATSQKVIFGKKLSVIAVKFFADTLPISFIPERALEESALIMPEYVQSGIYSY